jgi:hypothetical protein
MVGRKKVRVESINNRDNIAIIIAAKLGYVTHRELREIEISERRVKNYLHSKNRIFICQDRMINGKTEKCYVLDRGGKKELKGLGIVNYYKSCSTRHDSILKDIVLKELKFDGLTRYISEAELKEKYKNEIESAKADEVNISVADGGYYGTDNLLHLIEVVTSNYTKDMIQGKKNFCPINQCRY